LQQNEGPMAFAKTNLTAFLDCYDMLTGEKSNVVYCVNFTLMH